MPSAVSQHFYLLTAFGKDAPGLVAHVTKTIFDAGGNIEDASMTRLGDEFTMMLVIWLPEGLSAGVKKTVEGLEKKWSLSTHIKPIPGTLAKRHAGSEAQFLISVYGTDKPGIVYKVAQALADRHVNITDLNTRSIQRETHPVYVMLLEVNVPQELRLADLQGELNRLSKELGVEITLQDIEPIEL